MWVFSGGNLLILSGPNILLYKKERKNKILRIVWGKSLKFLNCDIPARNIQQIKKCRFLLVLVFFSHTYIFQILKTVQPEKKYKKLF